MFSLFSKEAREEKALLANRDIQEKYDIVISVGVDTYPNPKACSIVVLMRTGRNASVADCALVKEFETSFWWGPSWQECGQRIVDDLRDGRLAEEIFLVRDTFRLLLYKQFSHQQYCLIRAIISWNIMRSFPPAQGVRSLPAPSLWEH